MSRGHGKVERDLLGILASAEINAKRIGVSTIAFIYSGDHEPSPSVLSSVRRALRSLQKAGKVNHYMEDGAKRWVINNNYFLTAIHESGHAVVARALGIEIIHATVRKEGKADGHVRLAKLPVTRAEFQKNVLMTMAGRIAVTRAVQQGFVILRTHDGEIVNSHGTASDNRAIRRSIFGVIGQVQGDNILAYEDEVTAYRGKASKEAERLVSAHWDSILIVATVLVVRGKLTGEEIDLATKKSKTRMRSTHKQRIRATRLAETGRMVATAFP